TGMTHTPHEMIAGVDGTAYIRGNFGGTPYRRFIRLDRRGQVVTDFPAFTEIVEFMRRLDDGRLFLVTTWNGNRTVVILQPNGLPDPAYTPAGTFDERINAVAEQPDGKLILTGEFTECAGEPARGHLRLLPSGGRDPDYDASTSFTGNVFCSLAVADALYVPGYVLLSHSGDSSAFQGYPNLNRGPVR